MESAGERLFGILIKVVGHVIECKRTVWVSRLGASVSHATRP